MSAAQDFAELLRRLTKDEVSFNDFFQQILQRGAVPDGQHRAELLLLEQWAKTGALDPRMQRLLAGKLAQIQASARTVVAPAPPTSDATVVNPGAPAGDATTLNPDAGAGDADILDLSIPGAVEAENEKTQMTARGEGNTTFTPKATRSEPSTGSRSSISQSSWERVARGEAPERDIMPGDMLKGRFLLEKELGRGGMGVVFKARDERKVEAQDRNPWVAVKVLNDEFRRHPQSLIALQREARKAQQLTHDNVLRVFDFDKDGTVVYVTMEYVDGGTLKDFLKPFKTGLPFAEARPIIDGLANGLDRAHRDGIVHSDFKPGNVMMTQDRIPKIFDLGIARAAKSGTADAKSGGETTVFDASTLGALTPAYASLEMLRGESPEIVDDIYALGIVAYELLSGGHPFKKKNAEQALSDGLKPERIPGLTRRQWQTIEKSLAFRRADRLQTAKEMIEGLRPRTTKELAIPIGGALMGLLLLAMIALGPGRNYLKQQKIDKLVQRFEQGQFAGTDEAVTELDDLGADRNTTLQQSAAPIQDYFFKLAAAKWTPDQGLYDYPDALSILTTLDGLYNQDSRRVSEYISRIGNEKNQTLSRLNDEYAQRLATAKLFLDTPESAAETLANVRRIDAQHPLLKDTRLLIAYATSLRQTVQAGDIALAEKRLGAALKDYPQADALKNLQSDVKAIRDAELAKTKQAEQQKQMAQMSLDQARSQLAQLAGNPQATPEWQGQVEVALGKLANEVSPENDRLKLTLASVFAQQVAQKTGEKSFTAAQLLADRGLQLFPGAPRLLQEKARLDEARKVFDAEQSKLAAAADVEGLKQTLLTRAAANDLRKAEQTLADLKARLPVTDVFLNDGAPRAIGDAYLRQAERLAGQKKFGEAQRLLAAGIKIAPMLESLKTAEKKYTLEAQVAEIENGIARLAGIAVEQVRAAAAYLKAEDPQRYAKLADELVKKISATAKSDPATAQQAKAEWLKVYPDNSRLAAITIAEPATPPPAAAAPEKPATETAKLDSGGGFSRPSDDPCKLEFAGYGAKNRATCTDALAVGGQGPRVVVVPGIGGGAPFGITKFEVTVDQFNAFCRATGQCSPGGGEGAQPRVGVNFALGKAYAEWLSKNSGFTYRIPTDAEWTHAASAQGAGAGEDFNCVLMQGAQQIKGGTPMAVNVGRPNPWGLLNAVGNASEWVEGPALRGGNFNQQMTQCTVDAREASDTDNAAGLRLVRELDGRSRG